MSLAIVNETREQDGKIFGMLIDTWSASLLRNILAGKEITAGEAAIK